MKLSDVTSQPAIDKQTKKAVISQSTELTAIKRSVRWCVRCRSNIAICICDRCPHLLILRC
jgi:hypothetical protein